MNINGSAYPLSQILQKTGHLPAEVQNKIKHQPIATWIKVLGKDPVGLAHLFNAIVHIKDWEKNNDLKKLAENTKKEIKKIDLNKNKAVKKIYEAAKHHILKGKITPTNPVVPIDKIRIPGEFSYLISLLQLFRTTHFFDSILQENGNIRARYNAEGKSLIELRAALRHAVVKVRNGVPLQKETLNAIHTLLGELNPTHYYIPSRILEFLKYRLGNVEPIQVVSKNTFSDGGPNAVTVEETKTLPHLELITQSMIGGRPQHPCRLHNHEAPLKDIIDAYFQQLGLNQNDYLVIERDRKTNAQVRKLTEFQVRELCIEADPNLRHYCFCCRLTSQKAINILMTHKKIDPSHYLQALHLAKKECFLKAAPNHIELHLDQQRCDEKHQISCNLDLSHHIPKALINKSNTPHYTLQSVICRHNHYHTGTIRCGFIDKKINKQDHETYTYFFRDLASDHWTRYYADTATKGLSWQQVERELGYAASHLLYIPAPQVAAKKIVAPIPKLPVVVKPKAETPKKKPQDQKPKTTAAPKKQPTKATHTPKQDKAAKPKK
jgi:hypothetical protein